MRNEQHTIQQLWGVFPQPCQQQVMVAISRMIQRRLRTVSPQQRQEPHDVLDKNARQDETEPYEQNGVAPDRVSARIADGDELDGMSRGHHAT